MPRKAFKDRPTAFTVNIPFSILSKVKLLLFDKSTNRARYGSFSGLISRLLSEWLEAVSKTNGEYEDYFYLQDTRSYIEGRPVWWKDSSRGYTSEILAAKKCTSEEIKYFVGREWSKAWPVNFIDYKARCNMKLSSNYYISVEDLNTEEMEEFNE